MRITALPLALAVLGLAPLAHASPRAFAGSYTIIWWNHSGGGVGIQGTADVNASVSPPSFVIPAEVIGFGLGDAVTPTGATTHQSIALSNARNAKGTFDFSGVRRMPLHGMVRLALRTTPDTAASASSVPMRAAVLRHSKRPILRCPRIAHAC